MLLALSASGCKARALVRVRRSAGNESGAVHCSSPFPLLLSPPTQMLYPIVRSCHRGPTPSISGQCSGKYGTAIQIQCPRPAPPKHYNKLGKARKLKNTMGPGGRPMRAKSRPPPTGGGPIISPSRSGEWYAPGRHSPPQKKFLGPGRTTKRGEEWTHLLHGHKGRSVPGKFTSGPSFAQQCRRF